MKQKQEMCVKEAVKCLQNAKKWLEVAMWYSGEDLGKDEFARIHDAYKLIHETAEKL